MRSEEWWRRALELLLYQLHTNSKIPFYIARRCLKRLSLYFMRNNSYKGYYFAACYFQHGIIKASGKVIKGYKRLWECRILITFCNFFYLSLVIAGNVSRET